MNVPNGEQGWAGSAHYERGRYRKGASKRLKLGKAPGKVRERIK